MLVLLDQVVASLDSMAWVPPCAPEPPTPSFFAKIWTKQQAEHLDLNFFLFYAF